MDAQFAEAQPHMAGSAGINFEVLETSVLSAGHGFGNHEAVAHMIIELYGDGDKIHIEAFMTLLQELNPNSVWLDKDLAEDILFSAITALFKGDT